MDDRGVKVGMSVVDADGKRLGKVTRRDAWGFEVQRGYFSPYEWVVRYDEVIGVEGRTVEVARSDDALYELASGEIPHGWMRVKPPASSASLPATPAEASAAEGLVPERTLERKAP